MSEELKVGDRVTATITGTLRRRWGDDSLVIVADNGKEFGAWDVLKTDSVEKGENK